jgi:hypothetical protein
VALEAFLVELLDGDDHAGAGPGRGEGLLIDPSLEDEAEAPLAEDAVGTEVPGGGPQLVEGEAPDVGGLEDVALAARRHRRDDGCRGGDTAAAAGRLLLVGAPAVPHNVWLLDCYYLAAARVVSSSTSC